MEIHLNKCASECAFVCTVILIAHPLMCTMNALVASAAHTLFHDHYDCSECMYVCMLLFFFVFHFDPIDIYANQFSKMSFTRVQSNAINVWKNRLINENLYLYGSSYYFNGTTKSAIHFECSYSATLVYLPTA